MQTAGGSPSARATYPGRRDFFRTVGDGIYGAALASLLYEDLYGGTAKVRLGAKVSSASGPQGMYDLKPRRPHFEPRARAISQLLMNGAPSQMTNTATKPKPI